MQFNESITADERWLFSVVLTVAISAFFPLAFLMRSGYLTHYDQGTLNWFHKIKNPTLDHFFSTITWFGSLWVLLPLYIVLTLTLSHYFENFEKLLGLGFWGAVLTTYALKFLFERKRPHFFASIDDLPIDPSFPSAHTAQAFAFTLLLWLIVYNGPTLLGTLITSGFVFIALSVAASRMYLQVHFPTDVLTGGLIAIIWGCLALLIINSGA
jgi:undecaprenyl-diphosphatase